MYNLFKRIFLNILFSRYANLHISKVRIVVDCFDLKKIRFEVRMRLYYSRTVGIAKKLLRNMCNASNIPLSAHGNQSYKLLLQNVNFNINFQEKDICLQLLHIFLLFCCHSSINYKMNNSSR